MGPVEAVRSVLARYADFEGRARRSELWWFALLHGLVVSLPLTLGGVAAYSGLVLLAVGSGAAPVWLGAAAYLLVVGGAAAAALVVPWYAVAARRLHDTDRDAVWLLVVLVPYASLVLYWFWAEDGRPGPNRFGPDPKGRAPAWPAAPWPGAPWPGAPWPGAPWPGAPWQVAPRAAAPWPGPPGDRGRPVTGGPGRGLMGPPSSGRRVP
ncbi:DUF805 domain-containing protein [Jannaschia sp. R86511]|uniref:DUF805 domain-containing protein n=1 Tax=Jannaschia sp. R86511 TaxID=3093853 RepID=UPI0036D244C1